MEFVLFILALYFVQRILRAVCRPMSDRYELRVHRKQYFCGHCSRETYEPYGCEMCGQLPRRVRR